MISFALPVSTIIDKLPAEFISRFPILEYKFFDSTYDAGKKERIFHANLALVQDDFYEVLEKENAIDFTIRNKIRRLSVDIGPRYGTCSVVDGKYVGQSRKLSLDEMFGVSLERLAFLRKRLPATCELAIENLNYYDTDAYDGVCHAEFYNLACRKLDVTLVLDTGHAEVTDINLKKPTGEFFRKIDASLINEVQLSKIRTDGSRAWDGHELPDQHEFAILRDLMPRLNHNVDVVIEYYRDPAALIRSYEALWPLASATL